MEHFPTHTEYVEVHNNNKYRYVLVSANNTLQVGHPCNRARGVNSTRNNRDGIIVNAVVEGRLYRVPAVSVCSACLVHCMHGAKHAAARPLNL